MTDIVTGIAAPSSSVFQAKDVVDRLYVGPHTVFIRNGVTINDRGLADAYIVDDPTGFGKSNLRISSEENVEEIGSIPLPGIQGDRTMTLTGYIRCGSYPRVVEMGSILEDSFQSLVEMPMIVTPNSPSRGSSTFFTHPDVTINCRAIDWTVSRNIQRVDEYLKRPFTVAFNAGDPRFYGVEQSADIVPTVISTLGRTYPRTYPLTYGTPMDPFGNPAPGGGNSVIVSNIGNWSNKPRLRFYGQLSGVILYNNTTGQALRLNYDVSPGDWIEFDTRLRTVVDQGGNNRFDYYDTGSDWLSIDGKRDGADGDNDLSLAVSGFDGNGKVTIFYAPTWISA